MDTEVLKFQNLALNPEMCEMGGNFHLQNGLNFVWVWSSGLRTKKMHIRSHVDASYDFEYLLPIFGKCDFFLENSPLRKFYLFECLFSFVKHAVHIHLIIRLKIWFGFTQWFEAHDTRI